MSWLVFNIFIIAMLAIDLGVFNRKIHEIKLKEAIGWSIAWTILALLFNIGVYYFMGSNKGLEFLTGYLLERSLSVDNIFVFLLIFSYFAVPAEFQHKVLFWGVFGALVLRAVFIFAGVALLTKFQWLIYFFGLLLIVTGIKLAFEKDKKFDPSKNPVLRLFRRFFPVSNVYHGSKFLFRSKKEWVATPLFIVLIVIETSDVVFAVDSIPAILAITNDPFIVYTSNVFAILGLRALYFAVAGMMKVFHLLHYGLSIILVFVGMKMLISHFYKISIGLALGVVATVLTISVLASIFYPQKSALEQESTGKP